MSLQENITFHADLCDCHGWTECPRTKCKYSVRLPYLQLLKCPITVEYCNQRYFPLCLLDYKKIKELGNQSFLVTIPNTNQGPQGSRSAKVIPDAVHSKFLFSIDDNNDNIVYSMFHSSRSRSGFGHDQLVYLTHTQS